MVLSPRVSIVKRKCIVEYRVIQSMRELLSDDDEEREEEEEEEEEEDRWWAFLKDS